MMMYMPNPKKRTIGTATRVPYAKLYRSVPKIKSFPMTPMRRTYSAAPARMPLSYRQPNGLQKYYDMYQTKPAGFGTMAGNRMVGGVYLRLKKELKAEIKVAEKAVRKAEKAAEKVAAFAQKNRIEDLNDNHTAYARAAATSKAIGGSLKPTLARRPPARKPPARKPKAPVAPARRSSARLAAR